MLHLDQNQTLLDCWITKCLRQPKIKVGNQTLSRGLSIKNGINIII